jgi:hypothetical protein
MLDSVVLLRQVLPVKLTNDNDGRSGMYFRTHSRRKKYAKQLAGFARKPFAQPTRIVIRRLLGPKERLWDADSIGRGNAKEIIDALVSLGWWVDDGPKYIVTCDYRQEPNMRELGPATMIEVYAV